MNFDNLNDLHAEFATNVVKFQKEFIGLYSKWFKKDPRLTVVCIVSLPIGLITNMLNEMRDGTIEKAYPEFPMMMNRYLSPFIHLKDQWGKISSKKFVEEYGKLYEAQFEKFSSTEEMKEAFHEWYKERGK